MESAKRRAQDLALPVTIDDLFLWLAFRRPHENVAEFGSLSNETFGLVAFAHLQGP